MSNFLNALLSKVQLNNERVIEVLNIITNNHTDEVIRIMAYLSDAENKPEFPQEIQNDTFQVKVTAYDIVSNTVSYNGFSLDTIYVQDELTAAGLKGKYAEKDFDLNKIKSCSWKRDDFPFATTVWRKTISSMGLHKWLEKAK